MLLEQAVGEDFSVAESYKLEGHYLNSYKFIFSVYPAKTRTKRNITTCNEQATISVRFNEKNVVQGVLQLGTRM